MKRYESAAGFKRADDPPWKGLHAWAQGIRHGGCCDIKLGTFLDTNGGTPFAFPVYQQGLGYGQAAIRRIVIGRAVTATGRLARCQFG